MGFGLAVLGWLLFAVLIGIAVALDRETGAAPVANGCSDGSAGEAQASVALLPSAASAWTTTVPSSWRS